MRRPKELYAKPSDVNHQPDRFTMIKTPCGLDVTERMPADAPPDRTGPSTGGGRIYDGQAKAANESS